MFPGTSNEGSETFQDGENFGRFFRSWLSCQQRYCDELVQHVNRHTGQEEEPGLRELVERIMNNYNQYFRMKSKLGREKVFLVLSPPWMSTFERSFLWVGGIKPMHLFELFTNSVLDLSQEQSARIGQLMAEIGEQEAALAEEVVRVEGNMTNPLVAEAARNAVNGQVTSMDVLVDRLRSALEDLVECADSLRKKTVMQIMEILNPFQKARFLAAFAHFDKIARIYGSQEDAESYDC